MAFFTALGDVGAAILGGVLGARWSDKATGKEKAAELLKKGVEIAAPYLKPDREDILKELDRLGSLGQGILDLIEKANLTGGIIRIRDASGKVTARKTENWLMNMLLKVEPCDRQAFLARLNTFLEDKGAAALIARLETLDNDWYVQYPRMLAEIFTDKMPTKAQLVAADQKVADAINGLCDWLAKKGVR